MSYSSIVEMAQSPSLRGRIIAAAAQEGIDNPEQWAANHLWEVCAQPTWGDKWAYAVDNWQVNANPDFGIRTDVISDADILSAVQAIVAEEA